MFLKVFYWLLSPDHLIFIVHSNYILLKGVLHFIDKALVIRGQILSKG